METTWWTQPEELDDYQKEVIALDLDHDHLVLGPPGSGKTNLLILRATHLYAAGLKDILVLTFGRVLREFLASGTINYPFPSDKIQTYVKWGSDQLADAGQPFDTNSADFNDVRHNLLDGLKKILQDNVSIDALECILIDEAQDYTSEEIQTIGRFAKRIFAVGDDRQRIYDSKGSLDFLKSHIASVKELKHHYRNGLKICKVADGIMGLIDSPLGLEATSNYDEAKYPSTVRAHGHLSLGDQVDAALPDIQTQLRAYPEGIIGVLCPRRADLRRVWAEIASSSVRADAQLQQYANGYEEFDAGRRVIVTTTHGAKGLEFRALHLLGMDQIGRFKGKQRRLAYTAVTRAKTSLSVYHDHGLPGYLERGLEAAAGTTVDPPKLADLFIKA